jgi:hypothetical protein
MQMIIGRGERGAVRLISEATVAEMVRDQLEGKVVEEQPGADSARSLAFPLGAGQDGFGLGFQVTRERTEEAVRREALVGPDSRTPSSGLTSRTMWGWSPCSSFFLFTTKKPSSC